VRFGDPNTSAGGRKKKKRKISQPGRGKRKTKKGSTRLDSKDGGPIWKKGKKSLKGRNDAVLRDRKEKDVCSGEGKKKSKTPPLKKRRGSKRTSSVREKKGPSEGDTAAIAITTPSYHEQWGAPKKRGWGRSGQKKATGKMSMPGRKRGVRIRFYPK